MRTLPRDTFQAGTAFSLAPFAGSEITKALLKTHILTEKRSGRRRIELKQYSTVPDQLRAGSILAADALTKALNENGTWGIVNPIRTEVLLRNFLEKKDHLPPELFDTEI